MGERGEEGWEAALWAVCWCGRSGRRKETGVRACGAVGWLGGVVCDVVWDALLCVFGLRVEGAGTLLAKARGDLPVRGEEYR